jgi:ketosteroid isomerase-like protein
VPVALRSQADKDNAQGVLGREMTEHRGDPHACKPRHLLGRRRLSLPAEHLIGGVQDPGTVRPGVGAVFHKLTWGVAEHRWDELPALYAERTDVRHPLDPLRSPALRSRDEVREHFRAAAAARPRVNLRPAGLTIHQTTDPEVIVAEFEHRGTAPATGEAFALPAVFVLRVQAGEIVSSRDYVDHLGLAQMVGRLDDLIAAMRKARQ